MQKPRIRHNLNSDNNIIKFKKPVNDPFKGGLNSHTCIYLCQLCCRCLERKRKCRDKYIDTLLAALERCCDGFLIGKSQFSVLLITNRHYNSPADLPCTTLGGSGPSLQSMLHNSLSKHLFRLGYCNGLLAGLPACSIKPLQLIQNAAARVVFNEPKRAHVTPLLIKLHWLPVAARIKFKALTCAYRITTGIAPSYLNSYQSF